MRISQASVFLVARSRRTPSLLSLCLLVHPHPPQDTEPSMQHGPGALLQMPLAANSPSSAGEVGASHTLNHLCCPSN